MFGVAKTCRIVVTWMMCIAPFSDGKYRCCGIEDFLLVFGQRGRFCLYFFPRFLVRHAI